MKTTLAIAALMLLLFTTSCNKNDDSNDSQNNTTTTATRLQRYIVLDGQDTLLNSTFSYDGNNRIATSHKFYYDAGVRLYCTITDFNYNSNDSVPSLIHYRDVDLSGIEPDDNYYEYFFYDGSGRLTGDSIVEPSVNPLAYRFTYFTDHFRVTVNYGDTVDCQQTIVNGNITNETDTIFGYYSSGYIASVQSSFDNHPNPFYYAEVRRVLLHMPENYLKDYELPAFKNNPLDISSVRTGLPDPSNHTSFAYTYNADGYPVTAEIHDVESNDHFTGLYFYQ